MMKMICACVLSVSLLVACKKKEQEQVSVAGVTAAKMAEVPCGKEIVTDKPVKVKENGMVLPVGTKLCFSKDNLQIKVELPAGYKFVGDKTLPVFATYSCICSASGSACQVFYADGLGFGCLQSSCTGACTGKFTYQGYTVDKIVGSMDEYFSIAAVRDEIAKIQTTAAYSKHEVWGMSFYVVNNEAKFMAAAKCDCEGTQACKLKTITLFGKKIYFCEGACNGCELTV